MAKPHITLITGPAASGKSTVADIMSKRLGLCAIIKIDDIKDMMPDGFYLDEHNNWHYKKWNEVARVIDTLVGTFNNYGDVIIEGYLNNEVLKNMKTVPDVKILLKPDLDMALERNKHRPPHVFLDESSIRKHFENFSEPCFSSFYTIDSTNQSERQTAQDIIKLIDKS